LSKIAEDATTDWAMRWRYDKTRERGLLLFYGRWLISPFVGFRKRWETAVYYIGIVWGIAGKYAVAKFGIPLSAEELAWRIPLVIAVAIGTYRFVLFPSNQAIAIASASTVRHLRKTLIFLSAELNQFVEERDATDPMKTPRFLGDIRDNLERHGASSAHHHETGSLYFQRFAPRVAAAIDEAERLGIVDDQLTELHLTPIARNSDATIDRIRMIASHLKNLGSLNSSS
jgi:hypothetical protein